MSDEVNEIKVSKRVAIYVRVSSKEQAEMYGVAMQKKALKGLIESKGCYEGSKIPQMVSAGKQYYYEDDISGATELSERMGFSRLLHDLAASDVRPFDVVAVYKIDRIARSLKVLISSLDIFKKYGIELISASESIDTSTAFGRAILNIIGVIAELERDNISMRTSDGKAMAVDDGVVMGAFAEYGYTKNAKKTRIKFEPEAKYVRRIFFEYVHENLSPEVIAQRLTMDGVLSPKASAIHHGKVNATNTKKNPSHFWTPEAVRKILSNEVYLGVYYYNKTYTDNSIKDKKGRGKQINIPREKWLLSPVRHKPIIGKKLFELAQERLKIRRQNLDITQRKTGDSIYILRGLLECDHCKDSKDGKRVKWQGNRKETPPKSGNYSYSYICGRRNSTKFAKACGCIPIPAEQIEQYITQFVRAIILDPQLAYRYQMNMPSTKLHIEKLEERIEDLTNIINNIPNMRQRLSEEYSVTKDMTQQELKVKFDNLMKYKEDCEKELDRLLDEKNKKEVPYYYIKALDEYKTKYGNSLESVLADKEKAQRLVSSLISKIVVYSRPKKATEKLAGKPKKGIKQFIPNRIEIVLKLPHELIANLSVGSEVDKQFGVRTDDL